MDRRRWWLVAALATILVVIGGYVGVALARQPDLTAQWEPLAVGPSPSATTAAPAVTASPSASPSPSRTPRKTPTRTPTKTPKKPTAKPTTTITVAPTVPAPPGCAGKIGTDLSLSAVRDLLEDGTALHAWSGLPAPQGLSELPTIAVPLNLLKAIAYQESGWQSACQANDGIGFGLFQVSADTQDWMNQRFGEAYDRMVPGDNVKIAVSYLEWLIVYFGGYYFDQHYDLSDEDLLNYVIAAFNVGYGALETPDGGLEIVNPQYVSAVRSEMEPDCVCQSWG